MCVGVSFPRVMNIMTLCSCRAQANLGKGYVHVCIYWLKKHVLRVGGREKAGTVGSCITSCKCVTDNT